MVNINIQTVRIEAIDGCSDNYNPAHTAVFQPCGAHNAVIQIDHLSGTSDFRGMQIPGDWRRPLCSRPPLISLRV